MKKNKFKIISLFFIALIISIFFMLKQYNKPPINIKKTKAKLVVDTNKIISDFENNEENANSKYINNIIQINGKIDEINTQNGIASITLKSSDFDSGVICNLQAEENRDVLLLKKGDNVAIKGICTGYLLDVILVNSIIIQ